MDKQLIKHLSGLDEKECLTAMNIIKSRLGQLRKLNPEHIGSNTKKALIFEHCNKILNTNIDHLYDGIQLDENPIYYVYVHCDPSRKIAISRDAKTTFAATLGMKYFPFYVGKGTGNRAYELDRNESHRKVRQKIKTFYDEIDVKILKEGLTEKQALILESKLIDIFGITAQGGRLVNLNEGVKNKERHNLYRDSLIYINKFFRNSLKKT